MICGRIRPDAEISVASAACGWLTVNVRYCSDSIECAAAAEKRASAEVERLFSRRDA